MLIISPEKLEVVSKTIANAVEVAASGNLILDDESVVVEAVDSVKEMAYIYMKSMISPYFQGRVF